MNQDTATFVSEQAKRLNPEGYASLVDAFLDACRRHRDEVAFKCMGQAKTFGELEAASRAFAGFLQHEAGMARGERIAVQLPNLLQYPIVAWGALRAGLVLVNSNPLYTPRELTRQLQDSGGRALVVLSSRLADAEAAVKGSSVDTVIVTHLMDLAEPHPLPDTRLPKVFALPQALARGRRRAFQDSEMTMEDIAALQYTGGTTGTAKGAVLTQGNLFTSARIGIESFPVELEEGRREVVIAPMPLYHVYGFKVNLIGTVLKGSTSVLIPDPRNIDNLVQVMIEEPFTWMASVNTLLIALMQHPRFDEIDFSGAVGIIAGGAPLVEDVAREWERRTGCKVYEGYGLSETAATGAVNNIQHNRLGSIGRCVVSTECKVVDDEGSRLGPGEKGELLIRGPQVMRAYWQQPQATTEAFDGAGWFRTGDIATIDEDGFIRIVDRKKDMVLVSGFNVYPTEVESVLYGHPDVVECAVIGVPDEKCGEAVKAFVVSKNPDLAAEDLQAHCREELTAYKVPRLVVFVDELPKSAVGKILRRELREKWGQSKVPEEKWGQSKVPE